MAKINAEKLKSAIERGAWTARDVREALANERNSTEHLTMPTLGLFSAEFSAREAEADAKLKQIEADALVNIPLLEAALVAMGESTETFVCKSCGKHRHSRHCNMCYEPSEY